MVTTRRSAAAQDCSANDAPVIATDRARPDERETSCVNIFKSSEVSTHNTPDDCWVIVRRQVYDVTAWVPRHPGGDLIMLRAGCDCTALFDSYHPLSARAVLAKFYIGDVAIDDENPQELDVPGLDDELADGTFYAVLKQRVHEYMRSNKIDPRTSTALFVKAGLILATLAMSYYGAFFAFSSAWASLLSAAVLGVAMAEVGVSIQHDANHGAFSTSSRLGALFGASLDLVGASSFMWRQQHMAGHHVFTNQHGLDPDIRVSASDVRRVTPHQPWHPHQVYQHVYLAFLYGLLAIKSVLVDDFVALRSGNIGSLQLKRLSRGEQSVFWGGKLIFAVLFVALPLAYSRHSWPLLAGVWLLSEFVTGWMLAFLFQVAHVVGDVAYVGPGSSSKQDAALKHGWAAAQVATSADFSHGSFFWTHISGGLNYQVVHHLFPAVCHTHYPAVAPIVMQTCREFGIPYKVFPTFMDAITAHFGHLKSMGSRQVASLVKLPSLATIG